MKLFKVKDLLKISPFVFIFIFLYLYRLDDIPSGFYIDEATLSYNAYSILMAGKDEYGKTFPLAFKLFGSYNPPLFTYFLVPFIYIFDLSIFASRFASAMAGFFTVIPFYLFLKESDILESKSSRYIGSLFFVITPWLLLHSRTGYEISLAFFLYSWGVYLLWKSANKSKFLVWSLIVLSISTYASYTMRFLAPMTVFAYVLAFRNRVGFNSNKKYLMQGFLIALLLQIPNIYLATTPAFFPKTGLLGSDAIISQATKLSTYLPYSIANVLASTREFLSQYVTYFSPRSLFFKSDPDLQRSIPELSVFYYWMVIPYFYGLVEIWKKRKSYFNKYLLMLLILAPLPAALTHDPFSTHRAIPLLFPLMIVITIGIDNLINNFSHKLLLLSTYALFLISLVLLWRSYFVLLPYERAKDWGYGYRQLAMEISKKPDQMFVLDQSRMKPHYSYLLFFLKYQPEKYHQDIGNTFAENYYYDLSFEQYRKFANIETRNIDWEKDTYRELILVGDELSISSDQASEHFLEKIFEIDLPDGRSVFIGYKTHPEKKCLTDNRKVCGDILLKHELLAI